MAKMAVQIENLPDEIGEETVLEKNDDGTICSKILGSATAESVRLGAKSSVPVVPCEKEIPTVTETSEDKGKDNIDVESATKVKDEVGNENTSCIETEVEEKPEIESESVHHPKEEVDNKETNEIKEKEETDVETDERDFDKNPTILYALVQKKLWKEVISRAIKSPKEARAFISRREEDGRVRWRLLPLHAAIVFKAPEEVVETLLTAYPKASEAKDDQGMLPLHLAFRNGASEAVVNLLLLAFPQSIDVPDRKGRVPLILAKTSTSPNREMYIEALEKGPSHYAVTALACARSRIIAEQNAIFEAKLLQNSTSHQCKLSEVKAKAEKKQQEIQKRLAEKENELTKTQETSQVLVDHVASLESQISTRADTERILAATIEKLEQSLKEAESMKDEREKDFATKISELEEQIKKIELLKDMQESNLEDEKAKSNVERDNLLAKIDDLQNSLSSTRDELSQSANALQKREEDWDIAEKELGEKHRQTEVEWANAQANCAILEAQLKKRMENEHLLASQVSNLASRLAESSRESNDKTMKYTEEKTRLEEEQSSLKKTIQELTVRLDNVTLALESTRKQQMMIVDDAIEHEEMMAKSMEAHAKMVSGVILQERDLANAKEEMTELLERSFNEANDKCLQLMNAITEQGSYLSHMNKTRGNMLSCVQTVTSNVTSVLGNDHLTNVEMSDKDEDAKKEGKEQENTEKTLDEDEEPEQHIGMMKLPKKEDNTIVNKVENNGEDETRSDEEVRSQILNGERISAE